ncbi:MAG: CHAP domain-containing protein [Myxococcota bacterium]
MARWVGLLCAVFTVLLETQASALSPCRGIRCSGHGVCIPEMERAYCFCDEGYAAVGHTCRRAESVSRRDDAGFDIARIAKAEVGRQLPEVGRYHRTYPGRLARYVPPDGLWCSDFVSWAYRAAGAPLTGGYQGGWLVTNNQAMRRWFERRSLWIDKRSRLFANFTPQPGDYVRIVGNRWGHSAIVERVDGNDLHLVEGNAGRRVRAVRYRDFRHHERIDGFGIASYTQRRRWHAALPLRWLFWGQR